MADKQKRRIENASGDFFVDDSCIDCGTCYWVAPTVFKRDGGSSIVYKQPDDSEERQALRALFSCPTNSIGTETTHPLAAVVNSNFPVIIDENIYHCGFHSEKSYGAASYFIQHEEGNILVDSPRYLKKLSTNFESLGGIDLCYLTHRDDVADVDKYAEDFNCHRLMHKDDITGKTSHFEIQLEGDEVYEIFDDLVVIPVPGHTKGHSVLLYKNKYLFTGDHLAWSRGLGHLYAFKGACWYDFKTQISSMERLLEFDFEHVLPGHGAPFKADKAVMKGELRKCIDWMKK